MAAGPLDTFQIHANTKDVSLAAVGAVPNANAASLDGQVLTLQPASGTQPGIITTGAQTIAGVKTFSGAISASNLSGTHTGTVSGVNTGDVTLAAVGAAPAAAGASLAGQVLTLQPASATLPGVMLAADKARVDGALATVARLFTVTGADAKGTTAVHANFAGNNGSNNFPGAFTSPDVPRNLTVTFAVGWDGGNVNVVGTNQYDAAVNEDFVANPGSTVVGAKTFKTVTSATKGAVGVAVAAASIGTGDALGVDEPIANGIMTVDGVAEAVTVDATNDNFTAGTTLPNGTRVYRLLANV